MVLSEDPTASPKTFSHPPFQGVCWKWRLQDTEHALKLLYAGQGALVLARETGSGCGEEAVSVEYWAWSAPTSQQPREAHVQTRGPRHKGVRPLIQDHPVKAKAMGGTMALTNDLPGFVPEKH